MNRNLCIFITGITVIISLIAFFIHLTPKTDPTFVVANSPVTGGAIIDLYRIECPNPTGSGFESYYTPIRINVPLTPALVEAYTESFCSQFEEIGQPISEEKP